MKSVEIQKSKNELVHIAYDDTTVLNVPTCGGLIKGGIR